MAAAAGCSRPRSPDEVDLVERAIAPADREPLLRWVEGVLDTQRTFMRTVLGVPPPRTRLRSSPASRDDGVRELIADFDERARRGHAPRQGAQGEPEAL